MSFAFASIHDFIWMGHHGIYVWSAWLISVVTILLLIMQSKHTRRRFFRHEQARLRRVNAQSIHVNANRPTSEYSE